MPETVSLKQFYGEKDPDRNFDLLRSIIFGRKLAQNPNWTDKQRKNALNYSRRNLKELNELKKKFKTINDDTVKEIVKTENVTFYFWTQKLSSILLL